MKKNTIHFFKVNLSKLEKTYELEMLLREFLDSDEFELTDDEDADIIVSIDNEGNNAARFLYDKLSDLTGYKPEWGTMTGVRPTKLAGELMLKKGFSPEDVAEIFKKKYYVNDEKTDLVLETCKNQSFLTMKETKKSVGLYVGIPFCPTRCLYCSFTSNQVNEEEKDRYLKALFLEISSVGKRLKELEIYPESVYFGGGTPTSLSAQQLEQLMDFFVNSFDLSNTLEFSCEAGRPDTITQEKLSILKSYGVNRISINPQTMNSETLKLIGRNHRISDVYDAFSLVKESGIPYINTDLIVGLPGEESAEFLYSLKAISDLDPDNITIHTLAVKRASKLKMEKESHKYASYADVGYMVSHARNYLKDQGYRPYYMYRQKQMLGNHENVSYAKPGTESIYNIRIMDEHQTIVALGAGGISKAYYPDLNKLERVPNVSNYDIYIKRIDEMIKRKEDKLYKVFEE